MNAIPMRSLEKQAEFARLLAAGRDQLFGYLYALTQNFHDAEELFQETTLILWEKFDSFEPETNFMAWACRTSHHVFSNYLRRKSRSRLMFSEEIVAQLAETQERLAAEETDERQTALARCLEMLRERDRRLVRSVYEGKQSMKQLAEREGKAASALHMAMSRIRRTLFACIQSRLARGEETV